MTQLSARPDDRCPGANTAPGCRRRSWGRGRSTAIRPAPGRAPRDRGLPRRPVSGSHDGVGRRLKHHPRRNLTHSRCHRPCSGPPRGPHVYAVEALLAPPRTGSTGLARRPPSVVLFGRVRDRSRQGAIAPATCTGGLLPTRGPATFAGKPTREDELKGAGTPLRLRNWHTAPRPRRRRLKAVADTVEARGQEHRSDIGG